MPSTATDAQWAILDKTMRMHGRDPASLVEVLHVAQETFGYLSRETLERIASGLDLPLSKVYGVATFYDLFSLEPAGLHQCVVCVGTACFVKSAQTLIDRIEETLGIPPDQTTADNRWTFGLVHCVGSCGLAPVVILDGEIQGKVTSERVVELIESTNAMGAPA